MAENGKYLLLILGLFIVLISTLRHISINIKLFYYIEIFRIAVCS